MQKEIVKGRTKDRKEKETNKQTQFAACQKEPSRNFANVTHTEWKIGTLQVCMLIGYHKWELHREFWVT